MKETIMNLFKNQNGDICAYSDEDFINLAKQKYPLRKISDEEIENDFTNEELNVKHPLGKPAPKGLVTPRGL